MVKDPSIQRCPEPRMGEILANISQDPARGLEVAMDAVNEFPGDANLRFLVGSILGNLQDYGAAKSQLNEALALAPDFHVARLQLGLMHLSSGDGRLAQAILSPLLNLPGDAYPRLFAEGLIALGRDEFELAKTRLQSGMAENQDNAPLNRNMQLIIDELTAPPESADRASTPHLLVQKYSQTPRS